MTDVLSPESGTPTLRLSTPGDLIAAVPVLMGFHPRDSLVVISTACPVGGRVGLTLRVDLPLPEHRDDLAAMVVQTITTAGDTGPPGGAVVLVVAAPGPLGLPPGREVAGLVAAGLRECGVAADSVLWAAGTRGGEPWRCYEPCGCTGTVADPSSSVAMVHAVADGRVVEATREDLAARLVPADPAAIGRREALLRDGDPLPTDPVRCVADAVAAAGGGAPRLDDRAAVALVAALGTAEGRDTALRLTCGLAGSPRPAPADPCAAEALWAALTREVPDPEAAEPAALLALAAQLRGDGAYALVALDRAEQAWPGHRLTRLIGGLLASGVSPARLRTWLGSQD